MAAQKSLNWAWFLIVALVMVEAEADPQPQPWPSQFHALLFQNFSGELGLIDLWYDWPNGRNLNLIQEQLGTITYDVEWTNGTSFFYDLQQKTCRTVHVPVGILRPNWLEDAEYLGAQQLGGFNCNLWQKLDFTTYWEDVDTKRPVRWVFYTGREIDVMTFEEGAALEDSKWQAPEYCFDKEAGQVLPSSVQGEPERWLQTAKLAAA